MHKLARLDHKHVWHPFTQMQDWLQQEPIVIVEGKGAVLVDAHGKEYLDANASIWTNLHGHNHPRINAAIRKQLGKIAHSSALGLANEPASVLAERLVRLANRTGLTKRSPDSKHTAQPTLSKVFFSDDGSTALEVALKLAYEFARRTQGIRKPRFLSIDNAYHGDTVGAVSLGHINLFHKAYGGLLFKSDKVMSPYCYRCPFNQAKPERQDARTSRKCNWECVKQVDQKFAVARKQKKPISAFVVEPVMQGAAGMIPQPEGWLGKVAGIAREHQATLIADEVMTGFGRTGQPFACQREGVRPDFLCLAKGLTGGYLPMAATLTTQAVFSAFLGRYEDFKTFFHGHSYTGNQLGAAASLGSLDLLEAKAAATKRARLEKSLADSLQSLWSLPHVGDIRQVGLVAGVELVKNWRSREPFPLARQVGIQVCAAMAKRGVLTRSIGNVIVIMPPYCTTTRQLKTMVDALSESVEEVLGSTQP